MSAISGCEISAVEYVLFTDMARNIIGIIAYWSQESHKKFW